MTLRGGPSACCLGVTSVVADLVDVEEIKADGPARRVGRRADVGFANSDVSMELQSAVNGHGEADLE